MPRVGVVGSVSIDVAQYPDGRRTRTVGGGALYVSLAASRAGVTGVPISIIGNDLEYIKQWTNINRLSFESVQVKRGLSSFFEIQYDSSDEVVNVSYRVGVGESLTSHALNCLTGHDWYHVCCRKPLDAIAVLNQLLQKTDSPPFSLDFYTSSSSEYMTAIAREMPLADIIFANQVEFDELHRHVEVERLRCVVVTRGPHMAEVIRFGVRSALAVPPAIAIKDVTGAGDTVTGTFVAQTLLGQSDQTALKAAVEAASDHVGRAGLELP